MRSYVIHVRSETDRLARFQAGFPACLGTCVVVPCVTVEDFDRVPDWWCWPKQYWAHTQSVLRTFRMAEQEGDDFLFFEDDAVFAEDFEAVYRQTMAAVPENWNQIYFGGLHCHDGLYPPCQVNEHILRGRYINWNHCFAVHRNTVSRLIAWLEKPFWESPHCVDHRLNQLHLQPDYYAYAPLHFVVGQAAGKSTMNGVVKTEDCYCNGFSYLGLDGKRHTEGMK